MSMACVYLSAMFSVWLIGHYGLNERYRSKVITVVSLGAIFAIIFAISGFRTGIGDTYFYKHSYKLIGQKIEAISVGGALLGTEFEIGFRLLIIGLNLLTSDPQSMVLLCAFITNAFNLHSIYRYAKPFELGIYLYFATVIFYVTMNGMRQALVASLFFWGVKFIIKGEWKKYMVLVLFLYFFHTSALFLIPVYFIARHKAWGKFFWKMLIGSILFFIIFPVIRPIMVIGLQGSRYVAYGNDMASGGQSVNLIRVLIMLVPLVLAFFERKRLAEQWPDSNVFIFMSLLNFIFIFWSVQYLYFYRVCIYFELFNLALIPRTIACMEKKKGICLYLYLIVFYFVFAYYQVAVCWGERFSNLLFK